ncbi:MAG: DNA repair protein RadC [Gammaproteobacteria bacterium]|nr:DNA repair protein RadC [Gammaproteobacteria bacterium]
MMTTTDNDTFRIRDAAGVYRSVPKDRLIEGAKHCILQRFNQDAIAIKSPTDTEDYLQTLLADLEHEVFGFILLDNRHRVLGCRELFRGTIDGTSVYPRECVKLALELNAAAVICFHNHPSGISEPSQADERITRRLKAAFELVDIRILDHLVVGQTVTSMASRGLL